jgi:hypothetical protein
MEIEGGGGGPGERVAQFMNWLRVLGTAERPDIDQGVRHQLYAKMALLNVFKTKQEPLELLFPRKGPHSTPFSGGTLSPLRLP